MRLLFSIVFSLIAFGSIAQDSITHIPIEWTNLDSVFIQFTENWNYPEGVYLNQWNQVSCDGICPEEFYDLKDEQGKIQEDDLELAYIILDTTHLHHSLNCVARAYQYGEANYINNFGEGDLIQLSTSTNASTHTQFNLNLTHPENYITTYIYFNSIVSDTQPTHFKVKDGWIKIDKKKYDEGIFFAQFHFSYINHLEPGEELFWSGTIYTAIK